MMLHIRVPDELAKKLEEIAEKTDRTKSYYARKAIEEFIEDYIDYQQGMKVLKEMEAKGEKPIPFGDVLAELSLDKDDFNA